MHPTLSKHLQFLNWRAKGMNIYKALVELEQNQWLSPEEIRELQWNKLKGLLKHASENVPYYGKMFDSIGLRPNDIQCPEDLLKIPVLTKEILRNHLEDLKATNYAPESLMRNATGGSTGEPVQFYQGREERDYRLAACIRGDRWHGVDVGDKLALLWGAPRDVSPSLSVWGRMMDRLKNRLMLDTTRFTEETMDLYARKLRDFEPKAILGYASSLHLFAAFLADRQITDLRPQLIISSAEVLLEEQRRLIESSFGCQVYDRYGSREVGHTAAECAEHSGLHINADIFYIEFVRNNAHVGAGEIGEIIITDLKNYEMPFIRYCIGDVGTPSDKACSCGRGLPLMQMVAGRTTDIIVTSTGDFVSGPALTLLVKNVMGFKQVQIIQKTREEIIFKIVKSPRFSERDIEFLDNKISEYFGDDVTVGYEFVDEIPLEKSGKYRFTISEVPIDFLAAERC